MRRVGPAGRPAAARPDSPEALPAAVAIAACVLALTAAIGAAVANGAAAPSSERAPVAAPSTFVAAAATPVISMPVDDAYVRSNAPTATAGTDTTIRVYKSGSSETHSYLKFAVTGVGGAPTSAKLRLYVTRASSVGGSAYAVSDTSWSERTITWQTRPTAAPVALATLGRVTVKTWVEVDVTPAVMGDGTFAFVLKNGGAAAWYSSAEGTQPPQLVVTPPPTDPQPPPPPPPPVAAFTASPTTGSAPLTVTLTDTSTGSPDAWSWDLDGDSTPDSTEPNPTFTYTIPATYTVTLTVSNGQGSDTTTRPITVEPPIEPPPPPPPVAAFTASPTAGSAPLTVTFTDTSTGSPDAWSWDLDGDSTPDSTEPNPTFTYTTPATYTVTLTVSNGQGSDTATAPIAITSGSPPFGCPASLASRTYLDERSCFESQGWWVQGRTELAEPGPDFPFVSSHVHMNVAFPIGETIQAVAGEYVFDFESQLHEYVGGSSGFARGGGFLSGDYDKHPFVPAWAPLVADESRVGVLGKSAAAVSCTGRCENRFTTDATSPFGKRMYQSGAWNAIIGAPGQPVSVTVRGWYASTDYTNISLKDSNLGIGVGFRSSELRDLCVPAQWTITYSLDQGAKWAFFYVDAAIHGGSKGIVVTENRTDATGSVTVDTTFLSPGEHKLLFGAWEKAVDGWNGAVGTHKFRVC